MIDYVAKRYGLLPTEVLSRGSTFDLAVGLIAADFSNYQYQTANGAKPQPKISQEQMLDMLNRVRSKDGNTKDR